MLRFFILLYRRLSMDNSFTVEGDPEFLSQGGMNSSDKGIASLQLVYHLEYGVIRRSGAMAGVETAALAVCRQLAILGHRVLLIAQSGTEEWREGRLEVVADTLARAMKIASAVSEADGFISTSHARSFFRFHIPTQVRRIVHFHHAGLQHTIGTDQEKREVFFEGGADAVLCVSDFSRNRLHASGVPQEKLSTLHNGFDRAIFRTNGLSRRDIATILFVGVLQEHKGPEIAIEAVARLRELGWGCQLRIIGSGDLYGDTTTWIDEGAVSRSYPWVTFVGSLTKEELAEEFRCAGFVLSPSRIESFGMVSVEAQACGCIPLVAPVGGLPETLEHGVTGIVVDDNRAEHFAAAVATLLADAPRREAMREAASRRAPFAYSWRRVAEGIVAAATPSLRVDILSSPTPTVSVVIPSYNYGIFLNQSVASVLSQTFKNLEIIIVNDGSTDDSLSIARQLEADNPHIVRVIDQPNGGSSVARNSGIGASRGQYILPLDADDALLPWTVEALARALDYEPTAGIAYGDFICFDGTRSWVQQTGDLASPVLFRFNQLAYSSMFRREVWESIGGYRTNLSGYEDWDFWIACAERGWRGFKIDCFTLLYRAKPSGRQHEALQNDEPLRRTIASNNPELYRRLEGREPPPAKPQQPEGNYLFANDRIPHTVRLVENVSLDRTVSESTPPVSSRFRSTGATPQVVSPAEWLKGIL